MQLKDIVTSTYFGNIVGLFSLVIGIVSLIWTIVTYRMTKKIEKKLPESQAKAINTMRFKEYRAEAIKALKNRQRAVLSADITSTKTLKDLISICNKVLGFENDISVEDLKEIEALYNRAKGLLQDDEMTEKQGTIDFIEITNGVLMILEKGEYDL